ncbi:MAG: hypothetical protein QHH10_05485 [Peptococcaceae bacterium]|nr:hypothetical protein [Peptococcaceae bacterium]MDH7524752.1 hypothetical protein [Peptococcaceae bacterium]
MPFAFYGLAAANRLELIGSGGYNLDKVYLMESRNLKKNKEKIKE